MSDPQSKPDDQTALREELRQDAARVNDTPFDPALHRATMARLRASADSTLARAAWGWWPAFALAVLVLTLGTAAWLRYEPPNRNPIARRALETTPFALVAPTSAFAYRQALAEGEEMLSLRLARDARTLLPPSAPTFAGIVTSHLLPNAND